MLKFQNHLNLFLNYNNLKFINCACKLTEAISDVDKINSKRKEIKLLINDIKKVNPNVDMNIFKALDNVNCDGVLTYKIDGERHGFLDDYDK